jgi:hypothetical protein
MDLLVAAVLLPVVAPFLLVYAITSAILIVFVSLPINICCRSKRRITHKLASFLFRALFVGPWGPGASRRLHYIIVWSPDNFHGPKHMHSRNPAQHLITRGCHCGDCAADERDTAMWDRTLGRATGRRARSATPTKLYRCGMLPSEFIHIFVYNTMLAMRSDPTPIDNHSFIVLQSPVA